MVVHIGVVPCNGELVRRHIVADMRYLLCEVGIETTSHALWACRRVKSIRRNDCALADFYCRYKNVMVIECIWGALAEVDESLMELMAWIFYRVWRERCCAVFEHQQWKREYVVALA